MRKQIGGDLQSDINKNTQNLERILGEIQEIQNILGITKKCGQEGTSTLNADASEFKPSAANTQQVPSTLNADAPEFKPSAANTQQVPSTLNPDAPEFKLSAETIFNTIDKSKDGKLSKQELRTYVQENPDIRKLFGVKEDGAGADAPGRSWADLYKDIDGADNSEPDGSFSLEEFKKFYSQQQNKVGGRRKTTNKRRNRRSNKKSNRKQRAGNLCQQNKFQQLSLMNDKLNIYAPYPNNSGPFPAAAFTGNYRIDGPLSRGTTVPQAIHQVNLRKNVYPGGKTKKNKINRKNNRKNNKKSKRN